VESQIRDIIIEGVPVFMIDDTIPGDLSMTIFPDHPVKIIGFISPVPDISFPRKIHSFGSIF
jgi:hypothetical protein